MCMMQAAFAPICPDPEPTASTSELDLARALLCGRSDPFATRIDRTPRTENDMLDRTISRLGDGA